MLKKPLENAVESALRRVVDPATGQDVVASGMVSGLQEADGRVVFALEVDAARGPSLEPLRLQAESAAAAVPGVRAATAVLTARKPDAPARKTARIENLLPGVAAAIAVASGKGGVGKSTVAVNLAVSLAASGLATGLLDADIYGPSAPRMLGLSGRPAFREGKLVPPEAFGVKSISMGLLVEEESALIWRGPMIQSALRQFMQDVDWGRLDVMVVDMPPGTGDAQLTLVQKVPLAGAVIVSTPQDIALLDARRAVAMFRQVGVPILGIVENMSTHVCARCGHEEHIFGEGGARREAERLGCDFLGEIPLLRAVRAGGDEGRPAVLDEGPAAVAFSAIADAVRAKLSVPAPGR